MIAERTEFEQRLTGLWQMPPPFEPDVRSRTSGIVPSLLMAVVVAGPSGWLAWQIVTSWFRGDVASHAQVGLFLLGPVLLVSLLLIPSLMIGRLPGRMTAIPGLIWLGVAALLFMVPSFLLASVRTVDPVNETLVEESGSTVNWEIGLPDASPVIATLFATLFIMGFGYAIGHWARGIGWIAAIVAVPITTVLWLLALAMYALVSFGGQSDPSPNTGLLGLLPFVTWIAAPGVAVLAGAELSVEEESR